MSTSQLVFCFMSIIIRMFSNKLSFCSLVSKIKIWINMFWIFSVLIICTVVKICSSRITTFVRLLFISSTFFQMIECRCFFRLNSAHCKLIESLEQIRTDRLSWLWHLIYFLHTSSMYDKWTERPIWWRSRKWRNSLHDLLTRWLLNCCNFSWRTTMMKTHSCSQKNAFENELVFFAMKSLTNAHQLELSRSIAIMKF